ncbi:DUF3710 domain-containing protein [Microlunatus capsulatus]|uniref:DUF3710 domain-containing protein n=1 Tax=Microlunatus capsulatus TaxID=99117 RepID=A0ABS4ZD57_9ACTN|nr:DUF3710 domain-containing protein [Microlunatus capsulatus]MBP2418966.1 hypothetical protein [Microlunatus capsulatus]
MIFRRTKKRSDEQELDAATPGTLDEPEGAADDVDAADGEAGAEAADGEVELDVEALDARDWRAQGPFDIAEVDEDDDLTGTPEAPRIDLGAMVLAGFPGAELRLQMSEETQQIVSAMLIHEGSALELGAYAAPRSGGLWSELREEIMAAATEAGGSASLAEGPFGVELRRLVPVSTPEGEQGYQPSRMWVAEGPRWLLRGIVYGQAALEEGLESPVAEMLTAFRSVVVRRGDDAMAPGDLLPLSMPQNLVPADEQPA